MRSGLAIEIRIWSKLCGPETCPKMFINSFIEDPSRTTVLRARYARASPATGRLRRPVNRVIAAGYRPSALLQLDIEAKRAQLLDQHVEGFGNAGFEIVIPADNRLVHLGAAGDVVRLDRQHPLPQASDQFDQLVFCQSVDLAAFRPFVNLAEHLPKPPVAAARAAHTFEHFADPQP